MNYEGLEDEFQRYAETIKLIEGLDVVTLAEIQAGITGVTRGLELTQRIKEVSDKIKNVEIREIIAELRLQLVDTKSLLVDTKEEVIQLKEENKKLEEEIKQLKKLENHNMTKEGDFYLDSDRPNELFCSRCWEIDKKAISLKKLPSAAHAIGTHQCSECKNVYVKEDEKGWKPPIIVA